jgi:hypothetical protein
MKKNSWIIALIFVVTAGSFLIEFWPLAAAGVIAMGFVGRGLLALPLGLLLDLAYGAPAGPVAYVFFPFTIAALLVVIVRYWSVRYFFDRTSRDTL